MINQQHVVVLCDFCLWGAEDRPSVNAEKAVAWVNKKFREGHFVTLVSRRLNHAGQYTGFIRDIAALGLEYTEFHASNGFPRADVVYLGGNSGFKEPPEAKETA